MIIRRLGKNISSLLKNLLIKGMGGWSERMGVKKRSGEYVGECYKCQDP